MTMYNLSRIYYIKKYQLDQCEVFLITIGILYSKGLKTSHSLSRRDLVLRISLTKENIF